jgi:hypothetical protein
MQNEWGDVKQGRTNIESLVSGLMAKLPTGTKLEDTALVSQSVAPNVIVSQGISHRIVPNEQPVEMYFSRVLVSQKAEWKMAPLKSLDHRVCLSPPLVHLRNEKRTLHLSSLRHSSYNAVTT